MSRAHSAPTPEQSFEGEDPPKGSVPAPQRYEAPAPPERAEVPADEPGSSALSSTEKRVLAVAGPISFILFMLCGLAFGGWYWSWIFFMIPGVLYRWFHANDEN